MPLFLRIATAVVALVLAALSGVAIVRDRPPSRLLLGGAWLVEVLSLAVAGTAVASLASGDRAPSMATFIGYLVAFLVVPVAGWALARLEPSKWGSVIIAAVGIVQAILVYRLQQVWTGV